MKNKNIPLKVIEKCQLIQKQVCYAYELGWSEGVESARQEIKDEKLNSALSPNNSERDEISALIKKTLSDLDHGCGPHIRDFIADLQKLSPVS